MQANKDDIKNILHSIAVNVPVFLIVTVILTALLVLCTKIPQSAIRPQMEESAEFLKESELFGCLLDGVAASKIDRYADSILLNIIWQYDSEDPLASVMSSSYYYTPYQNENENLHDAVFDGKEANQQYLRYWHGSAVYLRPLLIFLNIQEIYIANSIIFVVLLLVVFFRLIKRKLIAPAIGLGSGALITGSFFVPLSLEYTWVFLLALVFSAIVLRTSFGEKNKQYLTLFMISGMLTSYFDFLTCETLTLLIPLLIFLYAQKQKKPKEYSPVRTAAGCYISWGAGYVLFWISKWILASVVLGESALPYVTGHISERLGLEASGSIASMLVYVLPRNIACLFPAGYGNAGLMAGIVLILAVCYIAFVYRRKDADKKYVALFAVLGLLPYLRFLVFLNHSYLHHFFTYRAQLATVIALVLILDETVDKELLLHKKKKGSKQQR